MSLAVAVAADDLTGAADTGAGLLAKGFAPVVAWARAGSIGDVARMSGVDAVAIDMQTRGATASEARAVTCRSVAALREAGVATLYKKCDSLLRGHVGVEAAAAREAWCPDAIAIVAPAFPDVGRTTVGGRQYADEVAIAAPPIAEILERASSRAGNVSLAEVRGGGLDEHFARMEASGITAIVCDAETSSDLESIGEAGQQFGSRAVWVGTGGLIRALPLRASGGTERLSPPPLADLPILVVVGSRAAASRAQAFELAHSGMTHVSIALREAAGDERGVHEAVGRVAAVLRDGDDALLTLDGPSEMPESGGIATRLGRLLEPYAALVSALVVTGGDTATAVLRAWGTTALRLVDEIEPGVPLLLSAAPRPIPVVTKAGAFGHRDSLVHAVETLRRLRTKARR
jgi:D-threonate/D-erythronate kinase